MGTGIFFLIESIFYMCLLSVIFFSKKNYKDIEKKIYKNLIIIICLELFFELALYFLAPFYNKYDICIYVAKIYCILVILWIKKFCEYISVISLNGKILKYVKYLLTLIVLITITLITVNKIYFYNYENKIYTYGKSVNSLYLGCFIYFFIAMFFLLSNLKKLKDKKMLPLLFFLIIGGVSAIIQYFYPYLLLAVQVHAFITFLMYFTIENPDMKLLEELAVNKNLLQHSNEEKSNLLFKLTQDVKLPVENICNTSKDMLNMKKVIDLKNNSKLINDDANRVRFIINNVLNINDIDYNKIKVFNDIYDINKLYKELILMIKNKINTKVKLNTKIDKDIPILYGDNIKLKQILYSILSNSIKYTKQGNIEFNINHFIQYDVCRLIININDTGCGIDIDKINKVLNDEEIEIKSNEIELDLNSVKKLINILGGSIFIDSNKLGTKVSIVLDQRIYETEEIKHNKELNNYIKYIGTEKNVLLIDDNYEELNKYAKEIKKYNINVDKSMYGKDILNKIRNNIKYDLIIIDDEMNPYNAVTIMEELNKEEKFNTKVIIMLGINKEFIKEHYIKDYKFKDYIIKRNYKTEIERIINKYL